MMIPAYWFGRMAVIGGLFLGLNARAPAQEKAPIPSFTGERVIVLGVANQYASIAGQIARLEKASPQSYYVVVVNSTGNGE